MSCLEHPAIERSSASSKLMAFVDATIVLVGEFEVRGRIAKVPVWTVAAREPDAKLPPTDAPDGQRREGP
jgi:hypothetical protein